MTSGGSRTDPYAEWYYNSVKIGHGPSYDYHVNTYGKDFAYEGFADMWKAEHFDPQSWAKLFKKAGAGYVVLTTKHHDGFCLWPSEYPDYNAAKHGPGRDLFGELTAAVRGEGLRIGRLLLRYHRLALYKASGNLRL